jgi:hypothetical protein
MRRAMPIAKNILLSVFPGRIYTLAKKSKLSGLSIPAREFPEKGTILDRTADFP